MAYIKSEDLKPKQEKGVVEMLSDYISTFWNNRNVPTRFLVAEKTFGLGLYI